MLRTPRMRTLGPAIVAAFLLVIVAAPASSATPTKKTFFVKVQVFHKQNPRASGNCGLIMVAAFPRVKYASSATVTVKLDSGQQGAGAAGPGFHDVLQLAGIFEAPADKHWIEIGYGSKAGGVNADCSDEAARSRAGVKGLAKIVVTVEQKGACERAKDAKKKTAADLITFRKALAAAPPENNAVQLNNVDYYLKLDKRAASEITRAC